jgi:acid phosphatase family membrane protein YuiD
VTHQNASEPPHKERTNRPRRSGPVDNPSPAPPTSFICSLSAYRSVGTPNAHPEVATEPFWIALLVGLVVQGFKGFSVFFTTRRWNLRRFVETGGMPSSHSAAVAALSTAVGLQEGFTTALFAVTLYFSLIVMYDAAGLRRAAGRQAAVLNRLIESHFRDAHDDTNRLMELLGHTPFEVLIGAFIGVLSALLWNRIHPL